MIRALRSLALVVRDYDEAIAWYVGVLGLTLIEDTPLPGVDGKRWVVVAPVGGGASIVLARAAGDAQAARIGDQTGGRVFLFVESDDFAADFGRLSAAGVRFIEGPRREAYGSVAVFLDLYGNKWDLIGPGGDA
jgi:catechol 2,3-dioxygenase-like lactoylglutathione lyase family enzyme